MEHIVGIMWNKNEGDILAEIIWEAVRRVDSLMIADDGSTDNSWDIIKTFKKNYPKIEHIQQNPDPNDKGQRQALLNEVRRRYKPENTWTQVIESDIMILDSDIRTAIAEHNVLDIGVSWQTLNAVNRDWEGIDFYPHWPVSIKTVMPFSGYMEHMLYTFRPLPKLSYYSDYWRPWPNGFSHYVDDNTSVKQDLRYDNAPLLAHYGFRGPTHYYNKCGGPGKRHRKYTTWDLSTPQTIKETVHFFNGTWNKGRIHCSRQGWLQWRQDKRAARK